MSLTNKEILDRANVRYQVEFNAGIEDAEVTFRDHVRVVQSTGSYYDPIAKEHKIIWSEPPGELPEDKGEVPFRTKALNEIGVTRRQFSEGIRAQVSDLRNPLTYETYANDANEYGGQVTYTQDRWFWRYMLAGNSATYGYAYDGQFFFDTDHPGGDADGTPTTYSNFFEHALSDTNLTLVLKAMVEYRTRSGRLYGNRWKSSTQMPMTDRDSRPSPGAAFHLMVGPALMTTASELANMAKADPSSFAGTFDWGLYPELTGDYANDWIIKFHSTKRKPIAFVDGGSAMAMIHGQNSERSMLYDVGEWIVRADFGYAYDKWHCAALSRPAGG